MCKRCLMVVFLIIVVINWDNCMAQSYPNHRASEKSYSTIELRGNIYGLPDQHVNLVLNIVPDSLKIDTLLVGSTLIVTKNGEEYLEVDSARHFNFTLEIGHKYTLEYIHPDYVTKCVVVDATTVPEFDEDLVMTIDMSMFSPVVATELTEPLTVAQYNHQIEKMDWDMELFEKQVAKMLKME